tara:strand:+ start:254 stop:1069 length:816 start_codon:yes stop_codon:yes gene_type:complete
MVSVVKFFGYGYEMGGLGNGLFQIATGLSLAKKNQDEFVLSDEPEWIYNNYLNEPIKILNGRKWKYDFTQQGFHYTPIPYQKDMRINGYFQSEKYFKECEKHIKEKLRLKKEHEGMLNEKYKSLAGDSKTCSVHVRRGDYVTMDSHRLLKKEYHIEAIKQIKYANKDTKFLFFSDDIEWCKENFNDDNYIFIDGNDNAHQGQGDDILDIYLMKLCHDNIICNSSFSWWGAWLNDNSRKIVISPQKWFGSGSSSLGGHMNDVIPESWTQLIY